MPAPPIMDLGSGMNTQKVIQQLLDLEKVPIQRLEAENGKSKVYIEAWQAAKKRTIVLQEKSRTLYSFAGPFARKKVSSSDPGAITGEAAASVKDTTQQIEVISLATKHQIHSDRIDTHKELPPAKFKVMVDEKEVTISFSGGDLSDLTETLRKKGSGIFDVYNIRVDPGHSLLGMKSSLTGKRGRLRFEDPDGFLKSIGLTGIGESTPRDKEELLFHKEIIKVNKTDSNASPFTISGGKKEIEIERSTNVVYGRSFPAGTSFTLQVENEQVKEGDSKAKEGSAKSSAVPVSGDASSSGYVTKRESVRTGPEIKVQIEDVELKGYQIERSREKKIPLPGEENGASNNSENSPAGTSDQPAAVKGSAFGIVWKENGERVEKRIPLKGGENQVDAHSVTSGKEISEIYFVTDSGNKTKISSFFAEIPEDDSNGLHAKNVTEKAADAKIKINGVEITRPDNNGIKDLIDGVSLNLHRVTDGNVDVIIEADKESIVTAVEEWVAAYNDILRFLKENSKTASEDDFRQNRPANDKDSIGEGLDTMDTIKGIFSTDSTVRRLVNQLRLMVGSSYPSNTDPSYRILDDIGIHTGKPGENWEDIKNGYLKVDKDKLTDALSTSPESVKELFVSDRNQDLLPDNGVAYSMAEGLKPYTRNSGGLITARIDLLKTKISDNKKQMDRMQLSLKTKEEKLRMKFGAMEQAVHESKSVGKYLKNNLKGAE